MDAWDVVDHENDMNIINGTWAFKCKQFPNGTVKNFKARFCAHGDEQFKGIISLRHMHILSNGPLFA